MEGMDKEDYIKNTESLLAQPAYKTIDRDPTSKIKTKLFTTLRKIKKDTNINEGTYRKMYPTGCMPPSFTDYLKSITGAPLRPIVSSRGSFTYGVAKVLTKVLKPLVGKSFHHIQSTSGFVNKAKGVTLLLGECLTPYNVTALFTSVPIDPALNIIKDLLEKDERLQTEQYYQYRTSLSFWGSVCIILTSPFKINSMSRLKEQLYGSK